MRGLCSPKGQAHGEPVSDFGSGSGLGPATCREVRSDVVLVTASLPLTCWNVMEMWIRRLVRQVVVLDVVSSRPIRPCQQHRGFWAPMRRSHDAATPVLARVPKAALSRAARSAPLMDREKLLAA
jgi:hypothetical protein